MRHGDTLPNKGREVYFSWLPINILAFTRLPVKRIAENISETKERAQHQDRQRCFLQGTDLKLKAPTGALG
jgi:hypothetical protein